MRNKKLLSTVLAASLVATTMAMPVMAAGNDPDSGELTTQVGVKTSVLRVQVPTALVVEIDQYDTAGNGSQIYSTDFDMTNLSNINVKVDVESTATKSAGGAVANLTAKKEDVDKASGDAVWLAVAAKTQYSGDVFGKKIKDLKESDANVTTFGSASGDAKQTFYLKAASGDANAAQYHAITSGDAAKAVAHTLYYQLGGKMVRSGDVLETMKTKDVYVVSGDTVTKLPMKANATSTDLLSYTDGQTAYVVSGDTKNAAQMKTYTGPDTFLWGEMSAAAADHKGEASFRYIGKLSDNKKWDNSEIAQVKINYTITGVTPDKYGEVAGDLTYGLYKEKPKNAAPSIAIREYTLVADTALNINVDLGAGDKGATAVTAVKLGDLDLIAAGLASYSNSVVTLPQQAVNNLRSVQGAETISIVFNDTAITSIPVTCN